MTVKDEGFRVKLCAVEVAFLDISVILHPPSPFLNARICLLLLGAKG
jgi:hypothetical protein